MTSNPDELTGATTKAQGPDARPGKPGRNEGRDSDERDHARDPAAGVVPGDQAAGRIPDPLVRTELAYLTAQQAKRRASAHLSEGHAAGAALQEIHDAQRTISAALATAPAGLAGELQDEADALRFLAEETEHGTLTRAAKFSSTDATRKSRHRSRRYDAP